MASLVVCLSATAETFRASAVQLDITPQNSQWLLGYAARHSTGVHDHIYTRVVAFESGGVQFYLASSDLCLFSPALYDQVARELQTTERIDPEHFWWTVTHTHSAPEIGAPDIYKALLGRSDHEWDREYTSEITSALIRAVRLARERLEPAKIAFGEGLSFANINRRAKDIDGTVSLGLNPEGAVDRQIGLIQIEKLDGTLIALIANYAIHGTVLSGENLEISGDAPGTVTAYLEKKLGGVAVFVNGAAGNIAPIYSGYRNPRAGHLSQFDVLLGDRIIEAARSLGPAASDVTISTGATTVNTPMKGDLHWPEELARYYKTIDGRGAVALPVRFLQINDTFIWSAPLELFCEIAMHVREHSTFPHTFYFGYGNGWFGYLPTAQAFREGGYEPNTSPFTGDAERDLERAIITRINGRSRE